MYTPKKNQFLTNHLMEKVSDIKSFTDERATEKQFILNKRVQILINLSLKNIFYFLFHCNQCVVHYFYIESKIYVIKETVFN